MRGLNSRSNYQSALRRPSSDSLGCPGLRLRRIVNYQFRSPGRAFFRSCWIDGLRDWHPHPSRVWTSHVRSDRTTQTANRVRRKDQRKKFHFCLCLFLASLRLGDVTLNFPIMSCDPILDYGRSLGITQERRKSDYFKIKSNENDWTELKISGALKVKNYRNSSHAQPHQAQTHPIEPSSPILSLN